MRDWLGREVPSPSWWNELPPWVQVPAVLIVCFVIIPAALWFAYYLVLFGLNG